MSRGVTMFIDSPEVMQAFVAKGMTDSQIAARYRCTRESVCRARNERHIATPRSKAPMDRIWPLPRDVEAAWNKLLGSQRYG